MTAASPTTERSSYAAHIDAVQGATRAETFFPGFDAWYGSTLPEHSNATILDFGCGRGDFIRWLMSRGFSDVHGIDIIGDYRAAIESDTSATVTITEDSRAFLESHAGRFDVIYMKDVLEHVSRDVALELMTSAREALRPGGMLVAAGPHAASFGGLYTRYEDFTHYTCFTQPSLEYAFRSTGYDSVQGVSPRLPRKLRPSSIALRSLRSVWFGALRLIYLIERPGETPPPHFWPRIVVTGCRPSPEPGSPALDTR